MGSTPEPAAEVDAAETVDELVVVLLPDGGERYLSTDLYGESA